MPINFEPTKFPRFEQKVTMVCPACTSRNAALGPAAQEPCGTVSGILHEDQPRMAGCACTKCGSLYTFFLTTGPAAKPVPPAEKPAGKRGKARR